MDSSYQSPEQFSPQKAAQLIKKVILIWKKNKKSPVVMAEDTKGKTNSVDVQVEIDIRKCLDRPKINNVNTPKKINFEYASRVKPEKTVKLKILLPKNTLETTRVEVQGRPLLREKHSLDDLIVNELYGVPFDLNGNLSGRDGVQKCDSNLNGTSTPLALPYEFGAKSPESTNTFYKLRKTNNKSLPIMGKAALLAKYSSKENYSEIIQQLVMERFRRDLERCNRKSFRKSLTVEEKNQSNSFNSSSKLYQSLDSVSLEKFMNGDSTSEYQSAEIDDSGRQTLVNTFDSLAFLQEALGDYMYMSLDSIKNENVTRDISVGTSHLSSLMSNAVYERSQQTKTDSKLDTLIMEAANQLQIMIQTSKALSFCFSTKEFFSSIEQVEAERILLLASYRREVLLNEINKVQYEEVNTNYGFVTISGLRFTLKGEKRNSKNVQVFVCILECGLDVWATETIVPKGRILFFPFNKKFEGLSLDFEIVVSIYCLTLKKLNTHGQETYRVEGEHKGCHSGFKFGSFKSKKKVDNYTIRPSSFTFCGKTVIRRNTLRKTPDLKFSSLIENTNLDDYVNVTLRSGVNIEEKFSGFITLGLERKNNFYWNRQWASLDGSDLKYWNYPDEEGTTAPMNTIDLKSCTSSEVTRTNREICYRPRTLCLEVLCKDTGTSKKYFLSMDNQEEFLAWEKHLNTVLYHLVNWSSMNVAPVTDI